MNQSPETPLRPSEVVERVRFSRERAFAEQLADRVRVDRACSPELSEADRVRRRLLASHVRLSENMAPEVFACVRRAAESLGLTKPIEVYQAAGEENAANWKCDEVVFISLQGSMLSQLDGDCLTGLMGHEFGHHLAHTRAFEKTPSQGAIACASAIALDPEVPLEVRVLASRLSMAQEFTADRFAALATRSTEAPLRLMMSVVTGLPSERLKADVETYLAQARGLFEAAGEKESRTVGSHPEHLLRAYALALFSETDLFRELTGGGAGTRTLEEVDAILERLLTGSDKRVFESQQDSAVPPEIHEFALCAASLMANADATMDESESKALEQTFSSLIPNWKDLLDCDKAEARFSELLPLAVSGGESLASSVFHLLVHVMLADREVHVRELETLSAVGRSLGQEWLFDSLLDALVRSTRLSRTDTPVDRPMPALVPGKQEADAALDGLFAGVSRRGGGSVSLSRLLRILGKPSWDEAVQSTIEAILSRHKLELESPPIPGENGSIRPDQMLVFRLTAEEAARREAASFQERANELANASTQQALIAAMKHLRERLVSGDGRSPSVRLYRAMSGRHFDLAQLDKAIQGRSERIIAMLADSTSIPMLSGEEAGRHKTAEVLSRSVRSLDREFKARVEETGTRDLFVGYPFLVGVVSGFFVRAPLILHPFSLAGDSRGSGSYVLKRRDDDTATANQALIRLLFAKKGFSFTEELAATLDTKAAEGCESLLEALKQLGLEAKPLTGSIVSFEEMNPVSTELLPEGLAVAENAVVGFFPQSSSDLLQDYDELLAKLEGDPNADLGEALNAAAQLLPASVRPAHVPSSGSNGTPQPVIFADPTQREAVARSRSARLLVVDGPPGTGKSQTIVNLVADELARGGRVAIICEKRVALDVVKQRMDAAGIGHLAAVVHDVYDDRKRLCAHIADRLENPERRSFDPTKLEEALAEAESLEKQLGERARLLSQRPDPNLTLGQLHAMAASLNVSPMSAPGLGSVTSGDLPRLLQFVKQLHPFAWVWGKDSVFRPRTEGQTRALFADFQDMDLHQVGSTLQQAHAAALDYARHQTENPLAPETLEAADPALRTALVVAKGIASQEHTTLSQAVAFHQDQPTKAGEVEGWFADIEKCRDAAAAEKDRVTFESNNELVAALSVAARQCGSFFRFLNPGWYKASRAIREALVRQWPEKAGAAIDAALIASLERRLKAGRAWAAAEKVYAAFQMQSQLPRTAYSLYSGIPALLGPWRAARQLVALHSQLAALGLWPFDAKQSVNTKAWLDDCQKALDHLLAQRNYYELAGKTAGNFPQAAELQPAGFKALAEAFSQHAGTLREADRVLQQLAALMPEAHQLAENLADQLGSASSTVWTEAVSRGWAEAKIATAESSQPATTSLDLPPPLGSLERASDRLLELHQVIAREEALRLAAKWDTIGLMAVNPAEPRARRTPEQAARENLIRECRKQRNVMPLRTLVRSTARQGLLDVVPVWLMSPETTVILFPRQPVFDLLIVDEASQCTVENGLPVLTRARRAVIAGDDKQMPPSSFFKAASNLEIENPDTSADIAADAFDSESLLVLARSGGEGSPLRWHYRALFEELIAFSNHSMYGGSLLTIPATASRSAPPALRWVRIENGLWEEGCNVPEAIKVVDVLQEQLSRPNPPSVGVVTFNIQQRRAIMDEIDARRGADEAFARFFDAAASAESMDDRPFVKNLESVQGDERDVIIFSLGYAPTQRKRRDGTAETYVPARFGPLGQKGGERRLNVAVSRAKSEIIVVSSFDPSLLSVAHTKHDGPRLFKAFLEFARHLGEGRRNQAEKVLTLVHDPSLARPATRLNREPSFYLPLHHQVTLALESEGLKVESMVGSSEFRVPIALVHGKDATRYTVAVLCDEGSGDRSAFEDYVHVPNVLARRGWRHFWINARQWHRSRDEVVAKLRSAVKGGATQAIMSQSIVSKQHLSEPYARRRN